MSFETIREAQRKERSNPHLQPLPDGFWKEVAAYFSEKMQKYKELREGSSRLTDKVLAKFERELRNAARILVELYTFRERKIALLAWSEVATDEATDTRALTPEEKELFQKLVNVLKGTRTTVIDRVLAGEETEPKEMEGEKAPGMVEVEITEDVRAFMGTDLNLYGPYSAGDTVKLPEKYAKLLIEKGKAKEKT